MDITLTFSFISIRNKSLFLSLFNSFWIVFDPDDSQGQEGLDTTVSLFNKGETVTSVLTRLDKSFLLFFFFDFVIRSANEKPIDGCLSSISVINDDDDVYFNR
jgi:hypothetical protein